MGFELVSKLPSLLMNGSESSGSFWVYQIPIHLKQTVTESYIQNLFDSFFAPLGFSASEEKLIKDMWTMAAKNERTRNQEDTMSSVRFPECPPCKDPRSTFVDGVYQYYCTNADFEKVHVPRLRQQLKSSCLESNEYICIGYDDMSCMSCITRFPSRARSQNICEQRPTNIKELGMGLFAKTDISVGTCL
jgi:hypothetical protein